MRFFEILPGAVSWLTIILMFLLSWQLPAAVAIFIILFDIYWLLKTIYLSLHLRATFKKMKEFTSTNWLEKLKSDPKNPNFIRTPRIVEKELSLSWQEVYHLVILPMYKEPYAVVRDGLESLAKSNYPKEKIIVVFATEERGGADDQKTAELAKKEFGSKFFKFLVTTHPADISGEIPGKGANETWAAREAKHLIIDPLIYDNDNDDHNNDKSKIKSHRHSHLSSYEQILVSVFDADTQVLPEYFGRLAHAYLTAEHPLRSIYQPIPLFLNNIYQAPSLARVVSFSATFWQMMQQSRPERLTSFSSQSIPFQVLVDIGFWHVNVVSEDSRIFWQCYLHYDGDFRVEPLFYPVSMDANAAPSFWRTLVNIYKQQRRWGWGVENLPYLLDGFRRNPRIPRRKKIYWTLSIIEGFHSWATYSLMIFALGWLPIMLGGGGFEYSLLSYNLPQITRLIISLSMVGIASSAVLSMMLLPPPPVWFRARHKIIYFLQWFLVPVTLIVFGSIPALEAQTRLALGGRFRLGFWTTPKHRSETVRK
ncbi:MAG: glycosyltransferase family 2 protein [Patescibacteria group bacterium]